MKTIENWFVTDTTGNRIVKIEEENLFDCCIRGETVEGNCFWFSIITSPIESMDKEGVHTVNKHTYRLGNPNRVYSRLFKVDTDKLREIVTRKLKLL